MFELSNFVMNSGLSGLERTIRENWLGPVFFIIVGAVAIYFLINREIRKMMVFLLIAAIVGALIWGASALFGSSGSLSNFVKKQGQAINTILPMVRFHFTNFTNFFH